MASSTVRKLRHPLAGMIVFLILYIAARYTLEQAGISPALRVGAALLPIPAFAFFLIFFIRGLKTLDELERRIQLESLAIAFPLTLLLIMTLGLLELAIPLSPQDWSYRHVWAFLPLFYFFGLIIARRRYQ